MISPDTQKAPMKARFDWYASTIRDSPEEVVEMLQIGLGADAVNSSRGLHGYETRFDISTPVGVVASVLAGGANGHPNAWASGGETDAFVEVVRGLWPSDHHVSRMDTALDFDGAGSWDLLEGIALGLADRLKLKTSVAGDYHAKQDGRTLYVGSRKSNVFARLYEKGKQLAPLAPLEVAKLISPDWCRLEAQVRPQKESRLTAATSTPEEAWGFAAFTKQLAEECANLEVARVPIAVWREADDERAFRYGIKQYGPLFARMVESSPSRSWAAFGEMMGTAIADERRSRG
jgi:hypothetical protein